MNRRDAFFLPAVLCFPLAGLFALSSAAGIALPEVYAREAPSWAAQGMGQDWVDLLVAAPLLVATAVFSLKGSRPSRLLLGGTVAYTAYSLVFYALACHFNVLFLVYSSGLGLAFYALIGLLLAFRAADTRSWFSDRAPARAVGVYLIVVGLAFYALWLSEVIPALAAHQVPKSVLDAGLITNPVQVLDLGIVLPAFVVGGVSLYRRRPLGYYLAPVMLVFGVVMDAALCGMVVSMQAHNIPSSGPPLALFVVMTGVAVQPLWWLLRSVRAVPG